MKTAAIVLATTFVFAGCSTATKTASPLIPDKAIQLTSDYALKLSTLATVAAIAVAIYVVYDPLAPNWELEEAKLNDDTYRFSMKMKRYHTGGAGESIQIFKRRANQLQYENGFASYQILDYSEGIDSQTIGARRMAEGTIKLVQRQETDSFKLNDRY